MRRCEHPALVELTLPGAGLSGAAVADGGVPGGDGPVAPVPGAGVPAPASTEAIVCFPPTAASASYYRFLAQALADRGCATRVFAVQYPGRETRFGEAPFTDRAEAVHEALEGMRAEGLLPALPQRRPRRWPWGRKRGTAPSSEGVGQAMSEPGPLLTLLGHSLGAQLAFDAALLACGPPSLTSPYAAPAINRLVLSARVPDSSGEGLPDPVAATDAELLGWLEGLGGTPSEVLQDPELASMIADRVRGDLLLSRGPSLPGALKIPLLLLCGDQDPVADLAGMTGWGQRSSGPVQEQLLTGDHEATRTAVGEWISTLR